jgi:hypothetical protein
MGMFEGLFGGGFMPQMPQDPAMPMAINQDGQNGGGLFGGIFGGGQQQPGQGGGLLGLDMSGRTPLMNMGGQSSGLLGFGSPNNNPMMRMGMNMAMPPQQQPQQQPVPQTIQPQGRYMGNQWMPYNMDNMARPFGGLPPDRNTYNPQDFMNYRGWNGRQERI